MGPVGTGDTLLWMSGWAWQQDGDKIAAASTGDAGTHVHGAHPLKLRRRCRRSRGKWMVQTGFREARLSHDPEKPGSSMALAQVENDGEHTMVSGARRS